MSIYAPKRILCLMLLVLYSLVFPRVAAGGFRFLVWGDATDLLQFVVTNSAQIGQLAIQPRFNLFAGDLYDTGFNVAAADALANAMGGGLSETMFPVRGNHDVQGTGSMAGWQGWFHLGERAARLGASNYVSMPGQDNLAYSFDYENCHFVGLDIPGDVVLVQSNQTAWLDRDLAAAEARGVQHSFLFWHGPVYSCGSRHGGIDAPPQLIDALNKHSTVSAIFGGHAHVFAWTHMYTNRIANVTHPFEAITVPPVAENLASLDDNTRCDFGLGNIRGFVTVDVEGASFTVSLHVQDVTEPRFRRTFPVTPSLSSPSLSPREFRFNLNGEPGRQYRTESSDDGQNWVPVSTNSVLAGASLVSLPLADQAAQRLYRCVLMR